MSQPTVAIRALVIIIVTTVIGLIVVNVLVPGNTALTVQIIGVVAPTTAALLSLLSSTKNNEGIKEAKAELAHTSAVAHEAVAIAHETKTEVSSHSEKLDTLTSEMDGRLTQLLKKNAEAARALGQQEGGQHDRDRRPDR